MHLSVVIAVRDRRAELARCLAAIAAQLPQSADSTDARCPGLAFTSEIIVVDNGSCELMVPLPAGARVVVLDQANRCVARNAGVEAARGEWIVFTDSDCVPEPGWLAAIEAAARVGESDPALFGIAGEIRDAEPANTVEAYIARRRWIDNRKFLEPGRRFSPPFAATANLAVRRADYLRLGGLDPALAVAGEDADLCWRAAREGLRVEYCPAAAVVHHHRATLRGLWRQAYAYGYGNAELFARWRTTWGASRWIEGKHYAWAVKGFFKWPWRLITGKTALDRAEPLYDGLANTANIAGRIAGGIRRRVLVL